MEVNFFALVEMTRLALPLLKQGVKPIVVNISSVVGHRGIPHRSDYSASKFAVQGFSEAIRAEFARLGIDVMVVSPGNYGDRVFRQSSCNAPRSPVARTQAGQRRQGRQEHRSWHSPRPARDYSQRFGQLLIGLNRVSPRLVDRMLAHYG